MSSFQETTSSGQTTKTRDMRAAYTRINDSNSRFWEKRVFVNFVDGGGWLARKRDLERLVNECHYFINLKNLDMLEAIVLAHVPKLYIGQSLKLNIAPFMGLLRAAFMRCGLCNGIKINLSSEYLPIIER